ncbi:MAG TPA: GntR family transcriptional regulator [Acidobacteriaceae bacterium]|nr:GntR family transcriptional regulator [Acidobacteriaceae bacterium]
MSTLCENIAERLVEAILSGKLKPGTRLNESELSRQLEVSRAPIREALRQLQEQGLVVHHPRRGMFVVSLTEVNIEKINRLRVVLESEALLLCRANLNAQNERKLLTQLEKMERAGAMSGLEAVRMDLAFHRAIWSQTDNEFLEKMLTSLTAPLFAFSLITKQKHEQMRMILDSHRPLMTFIQGKTRKDQARQVIYEHVSLRWGRWDLEKS